MGIFDGMNDPNTMGLLAAAANMLQASGPSTRPVGLGQILGGGLMGGMEAYQGAKDRLRENKMNDLKMRQLEGQFDDQQKVRDFYGNVGTRFNSPEGFDAKTLYADMLRSGSPTLAQNALQGLTKEDESIVVGEGGALVNKLTGKSLFENPKPEKLPDGMRMGINGPEWIPGYISGKSQIGRAGATNVVLPKIEVKTGESIAGQVGPILKGTREQALAGLKLVDSAKRIFDAAESGNLYAGPLANWQLRGAQVADVLNLGGKDTKEKIANTRAVVRGMAEQAVAARSQLGGQAQISNAEQELLNKATSGDIADLTVDEILQIAKLNDVLGRQLYKSHQSYLNEMRANPNFEGLAAFYRVPSMPPEIPSGTTVKPPLPPNMQQGKGKFLGIEEPSKKPQGAKFLGFE